MSLFRTTAEVRQYINIDVNMKFDKLKLVLDDVEEKYIKPLLGNAFYAEFAAAYAAATAVPADLTADQKALLPFIQRPLAQYAAFFGVDEWGVSVGDLGIQEQSNNNSRPAPAHKVNNLKIKYITSADQSADRLLEYLELNASALKYNAWFADLVANTAMSGSIVYKTSIASTYIDIRDSRRVFLRLKKSIRDIEASYIKRLICKDQFDVIITQLQTGSLTTENSRLVKKLEPIIAKKALFLTLPSLPVIISDEGIFIASSNDTVVQKLSASSEDKKLLMNALRDGELGYVADEADLDAFLKENIADYPLISESTCWSSKPTDGSLKWKIENDPCNKSFSV